MFSLDSVLPFIYYNFVLSRHLIYSLLVSVETLEKNLKQMGRQLQAVDYQVSWGISASHVPLWGPEGGIVLLRVYCFRYGG